jgi:hypothetical protein
VTKENAIPIPRFEENGNKIFGAKFGLLRLWPKLRRKRKNAISLWEISW